MSNGSRHSLGYIVESTYGTTPATPTVKALRHNTTSVGLGKDTLASEELRSDRMTVDFRHGPKQLKGDIVAELSYGSFDDILEAVLCGTWSAGTPDTLRNGTTRRSYTMRRIFADLASGDAYHLLKGCEFNTCELSIVPSAIVKATFGIIGQDQLTQSTEISGATVQAALTSEAMTAINGSINEGGSAIATVTELTIKIENGMEARFVVGDEKTLRPSIGRSNVSGQITAYFEDGSLLNKFINETNSSLQVTLEDTAGNQYRITLPNIVYTGGQPDIGGEGPITLAMPFQAVYSASELCSIIIERDAG